MPDRFDTLLLLALPASGKSEVRNYLTEKNPAAFHMGPTLQLDDYPYVHLQLCVDEALVALGEPRVYHHADPAGGRNGPYFEPLDIAALSYLLADDYHELLAGHAPIPDDPARHLLARFDAASVKAGASAKIAPLRPAVQDAIAAALAEDAAELYAEKAANCPADRSDKTIVIEFARGGPATGGFPLPPGFGYADALPRLSDELLERAAILYIWVEPAESRRKNRARARPDGHGSILFHGTPEAVMHGEYADCDMAWLLENAEIPGTVTVRRGERVFHVPCARFDNRVDLTSFLRGDVTDWTDAECAAIQAGLEGPCSALWRSWSAGR